MSKARTCAGPRAPCPSSPPRRRTSPPAGAVFRDGDGLADPGYVLPSYLAHVLLRKGAAYRPPWIYNTWEPFSREVEETKTGEAIDVAGRMGFDVFTIEDGWQERHGA